MQGLGHGRAFGPGDAVVGGEGVVAGGSEDNLGAEGGALLLDLVQGGPIGGGGLRGAGAFAVERGGGFGDGRVGEGELGFEGLAALHGFELCVFEAADLGTDEGGFVLEGFELVGGGGHVELLLVALELDAEVGDVGFFLAAQGVFPGDKVDDEGALADGGLGPGF